MKTILTFDQWLLEHKLFETQFGANKVCIFPGM